MSKLTLKNTAGLTSTSGPKLVSIVSGKGGVGKSIIALNTAAALGRFGYRVLLVDANFSFGNLHILANSNCKDGLTDFAHGQTSLSDAVTMLSGQISILSSISGEEPFGYHDAKAAAMFIARLRKEANRYHFVMLDHASGIADRMVVMAQGSDTCLLTAVPEITSISDAYGFYKILMNANRSLDCRLLLNRCFNSEEAGTVYARFSGLTEKFLKITPVCQAVIEESHEIRRSVALQKPVLATDPESKAAHTFIELAHALAGEAAPFNAALINRIQNETAAAEMKD